MEQEKLLKGGKNSTGGDIREEYVAQNYRRRGYKVNTTGFDLDVNYKVDLIVWDPFDEKKKLYVQVKGFTAGWQEQSFEVLIARAKLDKAIPVVARVNKSGRIYFGNPGKCKKIS